MKTLNQFLEQGEPSQEPKKEDPKVKQAQAKENMLKKRVLMTKIRAVRGGATGIMASYEPKGEELKEYSPNVTYQAKGGKKSGKLGKSSVYSLRDKDESKKDFRKSHVKDIKDGLLKKEEVELDERLGGKGYSRKATGGGGDWPDSDRGAGNKAAKRAGKKVVKKSPTYLAHVHNKEEVEVNEGVMKFIKSVGKKKAKAVKKAEMDKTTQKLHDLRREKFKTDKQKEHEKYVNFMPHDAHHESTDAFAFVKAKIEKEVGKDGYVSKDNPRKLQSAADKAKARAHQAKVDKENAAERAKDPSQGRYPPRYSNRGSD